MSDRQLVHISRLRPHPSNIRQDLGDVSELADSIRAQGILQPLVVAPWGEPGSYVVLAGHRRLAAALKTSLDMIPVTVRDGAEPLEIMLVENCQRSDLSPVDKAEAIDGLLHAGRTLGQIGKATGLTQSTLSYYLTFLDLDEATRQRVRKGTVQAKEAVRAVRDTRQAARGPRGGAAPRKATVAAPWFSSEHPLAGDAQIACELAGHGGTKYGRSSSYPGACGECWEGVIRRDERKPKTAAGSAGIAFREPVSAGAL